MRLRNLRPSLFQATQNRSGERFFQGLLWYMLNGDAAFMAAFCRWAKWPGNPIEVVEEVKESQHRHDLQFRWPNGMRKNIELKLWASLTGNQKKNPAAIDLFIAPERYGRSVDAKETKTWESFQKEVVPSSRVAAVVFQGLDDFAWTGGSIDAERVRDEIEDWYKGNSSAWYASWFLRGCSDYAAQRGLVVSQSCKLYKAKKYGYWGSFFKRGGSGGGRLWNGFIFTFDRAGECKDLALVTQIGLRAENALKMRWPSAIPEWYPDKDWGKTGITFHPDGGRYTIAEWFRQSRSLLDSFSKRKG